MKNRETIKMYYEMLSSAVAKGGTDKQNQYASDIAASMIKNFYGIQIKPYNFVYCHYYKPSPMEKAFQVWVLDHSAKWLIEHNKLTWFELHDLFLKEISAFSEDLEKIKSRIERDYIEESYRRRNK